jgi:arylsulfatase A-like enzyme
VSSKKVSNILAGGVFKKKKVFLIVLFLLICLIVVIGKFVFFSDKSTPNIVLIIIDTLRSDRLGCYGFDKIVSPEIDEMAKHGVLFENVISQCSWTRPSIASMLTSRYPRTVGVVKEFPDILNNKYLTLAEVLKANGFRTIGITANPSINSAFNFHQGFDTYIDSWVIWKWMRPEAGKKTVSVRKGRYLPRSDEIFDKILQHIDQIEVDSKPRPVYVQINVMDVHVPFDDLREEYKHLYENIPVENPNQFYPADKLQYIIAGTYGAIRQVSHDFDKFVKKLRSLPGWDNTLFVITSDHGQGLDNHPNVYASVKHGYLLYESQVKVPLIFYHPIGKDKKDYALKPKRVQQKVRLLDLMPTILEYAGVQVPENLHGKSFIDVLRKENGAINLPNFFVTETSWRKIHKIAVYTDDWEYIEHRDKWGEDQGVNKYELQPRGIKENGRSTDKISEERDIVDKLKKYLHLWEKQFRRVRRSFPKKKRFKKEKQQLKSLGYLEN